VDEVTIEDSSITDSDTSVIGFTEAALARWKRSLAGRRSSLVWGSLVFFFFAGRWLACRGILPVTAESTRQRAGRPGSRGQSSQARLRSKETRASLAFGMGYQRVGWAECAECEDCAARAAAGRRMRRRAGDKGDAASRRRLPDPLAANRCLETRTSAPVEIGADTRSHEARA